MKSLIVICLALLVSCSTKSERLLFAKKEQEIKVIAKVGHVQVFIIAKALSDGYEGDEIYALNPRTSKIIKTRLVGPGEAEVVN
ncbi:MAG: flagella basal body P-ring formation protein FlgA [Lentisphaeraceae bacterium]|nr:flagella basal body P-ring formation protein FlgA [Lentisphaeraceae bacterium]